MMTKAEKRDSPAWEVCDYCNGTGSMPAWSGFWGWCDTCGGAGYFRARDTRGRFVGRTA
jgi:hypothetical protein